VIRIPIPAVLLVLFFSAILLRGEQKFSHPVHLKRGDLECNDCHGSVSDSKVSGDDNFPQVETCVQCHDGTRAVAIDPAEFRWKPVERTFRFDHQFHLRLGNLAPLLASAIDSGRYLGRVGGIRKHLATENQCEACHRGLAERDDHGMPQMSDCLVCHSEIDNPFSCETCHLEGIQLRPENHTMEFVDGHASKEFEYDNTTCLPCHGTNFSCRGCH